MPFITPEHRDKPDMTVPGDMCYLEYKQLVEKLRPMSWTKFSEITKDWFELEDQEETQHFLAWMVAFIKVVMPYEDQKEKDNGTI